MSTVGKKKGELIAHGTAVVTSNNARVTINHLISDSGGQGDVYHVTFRGHDYALKWYCKHPEDVIGGVQYQTISKICGEDKKTSSKFIWPLILVTETEPSDGKKFGYLMELLPEGYFEMEAFLRMDNDARAVRFKNYNAMLVAGMNIAAAMQKIHLKGWSYKDLNPKNFAIHPETGDILVVDNDNVSVDGDLCSVKGTKGYMAPEIPESNYQKNPTRETDYYSLAMILYRLFFVDHPMEGKAWEKYPLCTDKGEDHLYAINPVFHFDPQDDSNRPTEVYAPNALSRWRMFPTELRELFLKTFTEGIKQPKKRPPENAWIRMISKTRDKRIRINPEREQFVNFENQKSVLRRCLGLEIGKKKIALYPKKAVYQISIDGNDHQYLEMAGGITYNKELDKLMMRNLTKTVWRGYSPDTNQVTDIGKNQEFPLYPGVRIEFQNGKPSIVGKVFEPHSDHEG